VSGFNIALVTKHLCLLFYPLTRPCKKNSEYMMGPAYPHIHSRPQKKKNQKENAYGDCEFATQYVLHGTYKSRRTRRKYFATDG